VVFYDLIILVIDGYLINVFIMAHMECCLWFINRLVCIVRREGDSAPLLFCIVAKLLPEIVHQF
jgi:hypothetical protein